VVGRRRKDFVLNKHILIVSLDSYQQEALKQVLRHAGYKKLITAGSSQEAVSLINHQAVDAVVSAVDLHPLDGWRFARLVRSGALAARPDIPIVMMADGYSEHIAEATARAFQVNRFLPYDNFSALPDILNELFGQEQAGVPKARLLVVEDYPDTVQLVKRVLSHRFEIDVAVNGKEGLESWLEKRHNLVLLDVMLPEMSGNEVLKEILKVSPGQSVVMMTAQSTPERAAELILDGAVDYISKPFRADQLRQVCEIAVQREDFLISNQEFIEHEEALYHEKELAQITLQSIADGVIRTNAATEIEYMNPVAEELTGWNFDKAKGKPFRRILRSFYDTTKQSTSNPVEVCLNKKITLYGQRDITFLNREGTELKLDYVTSPIRNRYHEIIGTVMIFRDITEEHELAQQLEYQAKHDALTGLTNRAAMEDHLEQLISNLKQSAEVHALCYIDLDQFKIVNDTCGHIAGDQLLQRISTIILNKIRRYRDTLARFGGDEFVLLLSDCPVGQAKRVAEEICKEIQEYRFVYDSKTFAIGASIGVVPLTADTADVNEALRMADNACYIAKEKGRNRVHIYHVDDRELVRRSGEMHVVSKINHALENQGFSLFFQEIKTLKAGGRPGMHIEILIRMKDESDNWITPGFFLPAAERYNIAPKLDRWVVSSVMSWLSDNQSSLEQLQMCSINLSGLSLCDHTFANFVKSEIDNSRIPANKICFEITETAAISNLQDAAEFINAIRNFGCTFALDDFGSGMSSYAYLKALPVDFLKIDGMFVKDILIDPIDMAMVKSINDIGHVFGLKTIAEFVETEEIIAELDKLGVDFAQGYAIGKPVPIDMLNSGAA
jgi:diguanylate cyclase (GGDEF)-like protein/PAS domain S-box-containing protein